jgi:enoyl-CoA hydratase/3-hydroxyacyl-CoA dehydrogenase
MAKAVEKGSFKKEAAEAIFQNISFTTDYGKLRDADFIIEAAFEEVDVKHKIFDQCQELCPKETIFTSNSSHIVPEKIFEKMRDRSQCLSIHYFYPAEKNILVEIIPGKDTDPYLVEYLMRLYESIGKAPIEVKSRYSYAVDPVFEGLFLATALTVERGLASTKQCVWDRSQFRISPAGISY